MNSWVLICNMFFKARKLIFKFKPIFHTVRFNVYSFISGNGLVSADAQITSIRTEKAGSVYP